jgi:hypothetical protein
MAVQCQQGMRVVLSPRLVSVIHTYDPHGAGRPPCTSVEGVGVVSYLGTCLPGQDNRQPPALLGCAQPGYAPQSGG